MANRTPLRHKASIVAELNCWRSFRDAENILRMHGSASKHSGSSSSTRDVQRSIINASLVMLVAHWEAYVESLFEECVELHYPDLSDEERTAIARNTAGRLHTPNSHNVNMLFLNVGVTNVLNKVRWQNMTPARAIKKLDKLLDARHFIAHGQQSRNPQYPTKAQVRDWITFIEAMKGALAVTAKARSKSNVNAK